MYHSTTTQPAEEPRQILEQQDLAIKIIDQLGSACLLYLDMELTTDCRRNHSPPAEKTDY